MVISLDFIGGALSVLVRIPGMELVVLIPASLEEGRKSAGELEVPMRVGSLEVRIRGTHWCG